MRDYLARCRFFFYYAALFSFCVNMLMLVSPLYMMQVFDRVLSSRSNETLVMLTLLAVAAFIVMAWIESLRAKLLLRSGLALDGLIAGGVLEESLKHARGPGENPYEHSMKDAGAVREFLTGRGILVFFDAPWAPVFVVIMFLFHPVFGVISTVGITLLFGLAVLEDKTTKSLVEVSGAKHRQADAFIESSTQGAEVVYALGMVSMVVRRWSRLNNEVLSTTALAHARAGRIVAAGKFIRSTLGVAMLAAGAYLIINSHVSPGVMIAATLILGRALAPVELALGGWKQMMEAREAFWRLSKLFDAGLRKQVPMRLPAPKGHIVVDKVTFARSPTNPILRSVSFELKRGESLAIIGPSAAGKSTLARVVMGIWPAMAGAVRLDGANIATWDRERLGLYVGYLPQDVELFDGTVAENIARMADPSQCHDPIVEAARLAQVHEMILQLPNGYDTQIGRGGAVLSGGEKQRVGLARALFGRPRFVVLDEPNANLDTGGELALMQVIRSLKEQRVTLIMITHRPALVADVDYMMVLKGGVVESFGPRQEVLANATRVQPIRPKAVA
ncbi:MAG: type I secretion system permease/ATPase [Burkholderiales bacterium]